MQQIKKFLGPHVWRLFIFAVIVGLLWFAVEASFIFILQIFITALGLVDISNTTIPKWIPVNLTSATVLLISFGIIRGGVWMLRYYFSGATSQTFIREQKSKILEFGLRHAHELSSFDILTAFNDHINAAGQALLSAALLITNTISIALFILLGLYWAPMEFFISMGLLSLIALPAKLVDRKVKLLGQNLIYDRENVNRILVTGLKNNYFLRIYGLLQQEVVAGHQRLLQYEKNYKKFYLFSASRGALPLIMGMIIISVVMAISKKYIGTPGAHLLAFFYIFVRIAQGLADWMTSFGEVRVQMQGFNNLMIWSDRHKAMTDESGLSTDVKVSGKQFDQTEILAQDLSFFYNQVPILENINFHIHPREILLIKGPSGSGKTTLLSIIVGLLKPLKGEVLINGHIPYTAFQGLAQRTGYVGPDAYLIVGSIRENLLYGHPDKGSVSDEQIWEALTAAQVNDIVAASKNKLDEMLLEHAQLSTGQKQRFAIARALLRKPSLLILDEATANLDHATESKFISWLKEAKLPCTMIVVSHRDSFDELATHTVELSLKT